MKTVLVFLVLLAGPAPLVEEIADSGRCADIGESADERVMVRPMVAPGPAPLISFRYYEGKQHHRFGNAELMLDDAGH